jgi:hypothetical protein
MQSYDKMMHDMHGFNFFVKYVKKYFLENFQSNTINQGKMFIYFSHSKILKILGCYKGPPRPRRIPWAMADGRGPRRSGWSSPERNRPRWVRAELCRRGADRRQWISMGVVLRARGRFKLAAGCTPLRGYLPRGRPVAHMLYMPRFFERWWGLEGPRRCFINTTSATRIQKGPQKIRNYNQAL